jgi:hypothetical protein
MVSTGWMKTKSKPEPRYHIKYATSFDGIKWMRNKEVAIDYKSKSEGGIVRASVIKEPDHYKMWYSYRDYWDYRQNKKHSYRIGYAESFNGADWTRKDKVVDLDVSKKGWDSQMLCYPCVIKYKNKYFMFYNGNGFGDSGIGFAVLDQNQ